MQQFVSDVVDMLGDGDNARFGLITFENFVTVNHKTILVDLY